MRLLASFLLILSISLSYAKDGKITSGPMQGHTTATIANVWLMVKNAKKVVLSISLDGRVLDKKKVLTTNLPNHKGHTPVSVAFDKLKAETTYTLEVRLDENDLEQTFEVTTLKSEVQDFNFLVGSCGLTPPLGINWMHPGIEERIYKRMIEKGPNDFMLWLGDYLYYLRMHYKSREGMMRRYVRKRTSRRHMAFMKSTPQYSIWDDHDFGPNDCFGDFELKEDALDMHKLFWANPGYGIDNVPGCYFNMSYLDVDFFMLDSRYYRTREDDSLAAILGNGQMEWLKQQLLNSTAPFKIIGIGSQVINEISPHECFNAYAGEYEALNTFLTENKIEGVIFYTGDRHHTELLKKDRADAYPLYDFTCSAITSFRRRTRRSSERENPLRIEGTLADFQNFGRVSVRGPEGNREMVLEIFKARGQKVWEYVINENDLKY